MLRTRPPLTRAPKDTSPSDLHVLRTPPAFVLSQDQTRHANCIFELVALVCSRLNPPLPPVPWAEAHHANSGLGPADVTVPITRQTLFLLPTVQLSMYRSHEHGSRVEPVSHRRLVLTAPPDHIRTCPDCQGGPRSSSHPLAGASIHGRVPWSGSLREGDLLRVP